MGVSKNRGTPKSSTLIGFSIINHPFWGTPIFGNIQMYTDNAYFRRGHTRTLFEFLLAILRIQTRWLLQDLAKRRWLANSALILGELRQDGVLKTLCVSRRFDGLFRVLILWYFLWYFFGWCVKKRSFYGGLKRFHRCFWCLFLPATPKTSPPNVRWFSSTNPVAIDWVWPPPSNSGKWRFIGNPY